MHITIPFLLLFQLLLPLQPPIISPVINDNHPAKMEKDASSKLSWMTKNLDLQVQDSWCYDHDPSHCEKYGRLYTWKAAKKACYSKGMRLPTKEEWKILLDQYGGGYAGSRNDGEAAYLALQDGGDSEFNARLGGFRYTSGSFADLEVYGHFWAATEHSAIKAWSVYFYKDGSRVALDYYENGLGFSCRCVDDGNWINGMLNRLRQFF